MTQHDEWWFPFEPAKWFADEALGMASATTRALWWDIFLRLSIAGRSEFCLPVRRWAKLARADKEDWMQMVAAIKEIAELGIADVWVEEQTTLEDGTVDVVLIPYTCDSHVFVTDENQNVTIKSRRLARKYKKAEDARLRQQKHREKEDVSQDSHKRVTHTRAHARSNSNSSSSFDSVLIDNESGGGQGEGKEGGGGRQEDSAVPSAETPTAGQPTTGKPTSKTHSTVASEPSGFAAWYDLYPKKRSVGDARKAWKALKPDAELQAKMVDAVEAQAVSRDWTKDGGKWIPLPATWLRADMWDDEIMCPRTVAKAEPEEAEKPPEPSVPDNLTGHVFLWKTSLDLLRAQVDAENFETWIATLNYLGEQDGTHYIETPSAHNRSWVVRYYGDRIRTAMELNDDVTIIYTVAPTDEEDYDA